MPPPLPPPPAPPTVDAGDFGTWVRERGAVREGADATVPCDGCTACCTSFQFVHIEPDETDTLAHVPPGLAFPAPGLPAGHVVLGYDERGHCPMLHDGACSIYEHRPRTCRAYDCRVFAATGVVPTDEHKVAIASRAARWSFRVATADDRRRRAAVLAAAAFLREHAAQLSERGGQPTETQLAVAAIEVHTLFLAVDDDESAVRTPGLAEVRAALGRPR